MRRLVVGVVVWCCVGGVISVGVAWGFALVGQLGGYEITYEPPGPGERLSSGSSVPPGFVKGTHVVRWGWGIRYELVTEMMWVGSTLGMMSDRKNRSVERVEVGWPMKGMEWIGSMDTRHDRAAWGWREGLKLPTRNGVLGQGAERRLPLVVLWPGFAVDAVVYGAGAWMGVSGWRVMRAARRRRRGLCVACGYELAGLAVCPECGGVAAMERGA